MTIMIVDDQPNVVSALKAGICWETLGITQVFTALNAPQAKEIIQNHPIDILVTDIEMPVENGLSLLRWCRQNNYDFECIFLTSHADFFYVQEALQLGSSDYILQPVRYEDMEKLLAKTIQKIRARQTEQTWSTYGKAVYSQKPAFLKSVLHEWFEGTEANTAEKLTILREMGVSLTPQTEVYLFRIQILSWVSEPLPFFQWPPLAEEAVRTHFCRHHCEVLSYCPDRLSLHGLIYNTGKALITFDFYRLLLDALLTQLEARLGCRLALYSAPSFPLEKLSECALLIRKKAADNVLLQPGLYLHMPQDPSNAVTYCPAQLLEFFRLQLIACNTAKILERAREYLQELGKNSLLDYDTLLAFCKDFEQTAIQAADSLGLDIHSFPTRTADGSIDNLSPLTLDSTLLFIRKITDYFQEMAAQSEEPERTERNFRRISNYVHQNLDKPLKCADIARTVFLSPDYVTRLFQREKGLSLKEYVTMEKMNAARELLQTTTLPISAIAIRVGYDNFSHFSQVYRRIMGISPSEERSFRPSEDG